MQKLQHSVAELAKIKNQIRVELNQIRYPPERFHQQRPTSPSKRIFYDKITPTSILGRQEDLLPSKTRTKRTYQPEAISNSEFNKNTERRHFGYKFADNIELSLSIHKKSSSYLRCLTPPPATQAAQQTPKQACTSLWGLGRSQKSPCRQGKRTYRPAFKGNAI